MKYKRYLPCQEGKVRVFPFVRPALSAKTVQNKDDGGFGSLSFPLLP